MRVEEPLRLSLKAEEIFVESDKPIVLSFMHNKTTGTLLKYRVSSSYMSVKPGVEALIYIPMKGSRRLTYSPTRIP